LFSTYKLEERASRKAKRLSAGHSKLQRDFSSVILFSFRAAVAVID
jgi:hypothetical protein